MTSLERLIIGIIKRLVPDQSFTGTVKSVDQDKNTCVVDVDGLEKQGVRLTSVVEASQNLLVVYPKVNSLVTCSILFNDPTQCYVVKYSEVESISWNGGQQGGMLKPDKLKEELEKTNDVVKALVDALTNWAPVATDGGAALKALITPALEGKEPGDFSEVQDERIKL